MICTKCQKTEMQLTSLIVTIHPGMTDAFQLEVVECPLCQNAMMDIPKKVSQTQQQRYVLFLMTRVGGEYHQAQIRGG